MDKFVKEQEYRHRANIKSLYGITTEDYNLLFKKQKGCCAICKRHQSTFDRRLAVDHCHTTKKIRGLLCIYCNSNLGKYEKHKDKYEKYLNNLI